MVRSLKGRNVDFNAMLAREEKTIAVTGGGERMNARGDLIDRTGRVLKTREELEKQYTKSENPVKNVSLSSRHLNSHMGRIIPGTENTKNVKTDNKTVSVTPAPVQITDSKDSPEISKPPYVVSKPIELNDEEFEEVVPKKPKTRRLVNPTDSGDGI